MKIGLIGCGYIAASYAEALPHHPELVLAGAWDAKPDNLARFAQHFKCRGYGSLDELLADDRVETILNLTNPRSHFGVHATLDAGKHVYSEKPLGMTGAEAKALVEKAAARSVMLASAPCSVLSETAETVWAALRSGAIGKVRLVYANFDDGMIAPRLSPWLWRNALGVPWPAKDEFKVGCTYEHAGYLLTWLAAFFGPARRVASFASCQLPDKGVSVERMAPDFTVGCLEYPEGVVARLTCSLIAPEDKTLTIVGDEGVLRVDNVRHERCPVRYRTYSVGRGAASAERRINSARLWLGMTALDDGWTSWRRYPYVASPPRWLKGRKPVDFLRGPSEMAMALRERRKCRLSPELGWHVAEIIDALQHPCKRGSAKKNIVSSFPPIEPRYGTVSRK